MVSEPTTPYAELGGEAGIRRLVHRFYQLMDTLPEAWDVRQMHPEDLSGSEEKLFMYLTGWLGGPPLYEQAHGHPRLRARHLPFTIASRERDQWLMCMKLRRMHPRKPAAHPTVDSHRRPCRPHAQPRRPRLNQPQAHTPIMKFLFDLFPIILFFVAYKFAGIFAATAVAIAATVGQIGWVWFRHRKVDTMLWVSLAIVTVFGGATLFFQNPTFIKWKPTVLYWFFAGALIFSAVVLKKNLIRKMLEAQMKLPEPIWGTLNLVWAGFFGLMGVLNLFIAYNFSEDTWVNFKLFGGMGLMIVFVLAQGMLLSRYIEEESN